MAYVLAAAASSPIAAFETVFRWLIYGSVDNFLGVEWEFGRYLARGECLLRAQGTLGQPIPLGYAIVVAIGFFMFLRRSFYNWRYWLMGLAVLFVGVIAPLSR